MQTKGKMGENCIAGRGMRGESGLVRQRGPPFPKNPLSKHNVGSSQGAIGGERKTPDPPVTQVRRAGTREQNSGRLSLGSSIFVLLRELDDTQWHKEEVTIEETEGKRRRGRKKSGQVPRRELPEEEPGQGGRRGN